MFNYFNFINQKNKKHKIISSLFFVFIALNLFSINAYASPDPVLDAMVGQILGLNSAMQGFQTAMEIKNFKSYVWGNSGFTDYSNYGEDAHNWQSVLNMAKSGSGSGELGQTITELANQFPLTQKINDYNKIVTDSQSQQYYAMQAQTALATRAASSLDFQKVTQELDYENKLRADINTTTSTKESIDLANRIAVEANLIRLQILREQTLSNQQTSLDSQGAINDAALNAHFLSQPEE